jgi:tRNA/rRNA methyltransferase
MLVVAEVDGLKTTILEGTGVTVASIVRACHGTGLETALAALAVSGLSRATVEPVLSYCAETRCARDDASCPGCRRRTAVESISRTARDSTWTAHIRK